MIIKTCLIFCLILIVSCASNSFAVSTPITYISLEKPRYLYELKYGKFHEFRYGLWDLYIKQANGSAGSDKLHKFISKIPSGYSVCIKSTKINSDFYAPHSIKMYGELLFNNESYKFEGSMTEGEYQKMNQARQKQ
jgi:hypothetical protein